MSILAPVILDDAADDLAPGPMMSRILSGRTLIVTMRGAYAEMSLRGLSIVRCMTSRMLQPPGNPGLLQRLLHDLARHAVDLDVHLQGGDARHGSPATLKSMSPR
jgi:hypothetical protein